MRFILGFLVGMTLGFGLASLLTQQSEEAPTLARSS
jgi:hypothetical protein